MASTQLDEVVEHSGGMASVCVSEYELGASIWSQPSFHPFILTARGDGRAVFLGPAVSDNQQENEMLIKVLYSELNYICEGLVKCAGCLKC